jgi:hypothetical protein
MENPLWGILPVEVRAQVDALVVKNQKIHAVKVVREGFEPRPGLYECMDLVAERYADLGQRFNRSPTVPLDLDALMAKVQLPGCRVTTSAASAAASPHRRALLTPTSERR